MQFYAAVRFVAQYLTKQIDRLGLVIFDADDAAFYFQMLHYRPYAAHQIVGTFDDGPVVGGDEGLAFGGVDDQGMYAVGIARIDLDVGGEAGPAQPHQTGIVDRAVKIVHRFHPGRRQAGVQGMLAVGLDGHRRRDGALGGDEIFDGDDGAGN